MINQQEKRSLSVGSAVQFTHKGKTIHGHLLQRQGRRRFAQVVDTEERTWKVPESALKDSGGARLATIITRHDKARADYRVGDEVTFTSPDGPRRGEIVKLNPKSAKVRCEETCWNISYGLLRKAGRESARNGAERLNGVAEMARRLMDEHGLTGWTVAFGEARKRLGDCHFRHHVIRISRTHALEGSGSRSGTPCCTRSPTRLRDTRPAMDRCGRQQHGESGQHQGQRPMRAKRAKAG